MNFEESESALAHELLRGVTIIRGLRAADYKLVGAQFHTDRYALLKP